MPRMENRIGNSDSLHTRGFRTGGTHSSPSSPLNISPSCQIQSRMRHGFTCMCCPRSIRNETGAVGTSPRASPPAEHRTGPDCETVPGELWTHGRISGLCGTCPPD
jgi:hypothetical protein